MERHDSKLDPRKKYLQIAFNLSLPEVEIMVASLPSSEKIIIEAGTPFVKQYGMQGVRALVSLWRAKVGPSGYVVADTKTMDRGGREVSAVAEAGASAATCLGLAPVETINEFIRQCRENNVDSMVDMMNVEFPFEVLQKLAKLPDIVVLHRGVDEGGEKMAKALPYYDIRRIQGAYSHLRISVAGGETERDVARTFFNDADIAVVWRMIAENPLYAGSLSESFLKLVK